MLNPKSASLSVSKSFGFLNNTFSIKLFFSFINIQLLLLITLIKQITYPVLYRDGSLSCCALHQQLKIVISLSNLSPHLSITRLHPFS